MIDIRVADDLWDTSMLPEGVLEEWTARPGDRVERGQAVARVRIEGALHSIAAPCDGVIRTMLDPGDVIEPGAVIGAVRPAG